MSDTKILQAILDGQRAIKEELKEDIKKVHNDVIRVEKKVDRNGERIDKLGLQLARLEDDTPTNEGFEQLEERVDKIEKVVLAT